MQEADIGLKAAGNALPLDGVVKEGVAVVQRGIDGVGGFPFLAQEEILAEPLEKARPEKAGVLGLKAEDAVEKSFP